MAEKGIPLVSAVQEIKGVAALLKRIRASQLAVGSRVAVGLKRAGLFLQRESQAIVPVQYGNLKASAFTRSEGEGFGTKVTVGYTAAYAIYVHENLEAAHGAEFNAKHADKIAGARKRKASKTQKRIFFQRGERQQAKFLEGPAREKRTEIAQIVLDAARTE